MKMMKLKEKKILQYLKHFLKHFVIIKLVLLHFVYYLKNMN